MYTREARSTKYHPLRLRPWLLVSMNLLNQRIRGQEEADYSQDWQKAPICLSLILAPHSTRGPLLYSTFIGQYYLSWQIARKEAHRGGFLFGRGPT